MTLIGYKDAGVVASEVIMTRQIHSGSFLIVEGEDDHKFWSPRVASGACELVIGNGKPNVEGALICLDRGGFQGALGIVDDDFDSLEGRSRPSPNLISTDGHDLESMLLRSPALDRLLAEYGKVKEIRKFETIHDGTIREALVERGLEFGRLRWLALRGGWSYPFRDRGPDRFLDETTWEVRRDDLHAEIVRTGVFASIEELRAALAALPAADPWSICQGHDLISILRIGLKKVLGDLKSTKGVNDIAAMLRSARRSTASWRLSRVGDSLLGKRQSALSGVLTGLATRSEQFPAFGCAKIDLAVTIFRGDAGQQVVERIRRRCRFDDNPAILRTDLDRLVERQMRCFHDRCRQTYRRAVSPLLNPLNGHGYLPIVETNVDMDAYNRPSVKPYRKKYLLHKKM